MRKLGELLPYVTYRSISGDTSEKVGGVACHSGKVGAHAVFVCIRGGRSDGHDYILEAVERGACVIVAEHGYVMWSRQGAFILTERRKVDLSELVKGKGICVVTADDTRKFLSEISAAFYGFPAKKLSVIGITGTGGKTTTMFLTAAILREAGYKVGMIGTGYYEDGEHAGETENTTPPACEIHRLLAQMAEHHCDCCVMEVSSQGIAQERVASLFFDIGVFLNIEPDHIGKGEHANFAEYLYCKGRLMRQCRIGIVNRDDAHVFQILSGHTCEVRFFSRNIPTERMAYGENCRMEQGRLSERFTVRRKDETFPVQMQLPGAFNVSNALAAIAVSEAYQVSSGQIQHALARATVPGRCENLTPGEPFAVLVDYAHNAAGLSNLLSMLRQCHPGRLLVLFGCGGNRSGLRRFQMGETAARLADHVILTTDNPRWEDPDVIIGQIEEGVRSVDGAKEGSTYRKVPDRREAIRAAVAMLKERDILVVAGKGCEREQEIRGVRYPMDDRELVKRALSERR